MTAERSEIYKCNVCGIVAEILNPLIAAGWVAGLVQAVLRKPTVADFENLHEATSTVKGFWTNPVTKILLVVVLANLGSILGTWVAGVWIASRSF